MTMTHALRAFLLATLMTALAAPAFAIAPFFNFVDLPFEKPTTAQRVKAAIVSAALIEEWTIVEEADGSLRATKASRGSWSFTARITYDATRWSIAYVESQGLHHTVESKSAKADAATAAMVKAWPNGQFAVPSQVYLHDNANYWIRDLQAGVRRVLAAPEI